MKKLQTPQFTSTSVDPGSSSTGFGIHSPKSTKNTSPSRKLQQVFKEALGREAEERAANLLDNNSQLELSSGKVQILNSNPKILINARGNPYAEGDPNLGYSFEDEELSDSEEGLLQVLEGVVSSNQGVGASNQHLRTEGSLVKVKSDLNISHAPEPPDPLGSGVNEEAAEHVSKGSTDFNKYLSKTAKKRLKKQAKEDLINHSSKSKHK
ncbi:hypothetical protein RHGRI_007839 [Rhododendron griersonianum]|uniref:Uncharacterized protein n=1 Tax=Rhododendron griersonianum TaxID=479676 RepID=A0AAV6KZM1_9ERIC|nr:hypothetical protein RHGRI_007839 [Rhododendron griersonianum]